MNGLARYGPIFHQFWTHHPALLYGLFFYFGAVAALAWHLSLLFPVAFLLFGVYGNGTPLVIFRLGLGALLALFFGFYVHSSVILAPDWAEGLSGTAQIEISNITAEIRHNKPYYKMQVELLRFESDDGTSFAQNIPCKVIWSKPTPRPSANFCYEVQGRLVKQYDSWILQIDSPWKVLKRSFSLVEWRTMAKNYFKRLLARYLPPTQERDFLEGVIIGEFHDPLLAGALRRFGLQHILVVSGFHFSLIGAIFYALLRLFLPWKATSLLLIFLTSFYLVFIGLSPSVLRAYVAVLLVLLGRLLDEKTNGLNALGIGLIITLAIAPTWATSLSFILSFLATFAILLIFPLVKQALRAIFPRRTGSELLQMSFLDQLTFVLLSFFTSAFALVASVTILMLPMSLYSFQTFPLLGIIYNCFFPFLVSISVFLLSLGLLFCWLGPVASLLFSSCRALTDCALTLVNEAPHWLDCNLHCSWLTLELLVIYLCTISLFGVISYTKLLINSPKE